jgi:hypothetical protein
LKSPSSHTFSNVFHEGFLCCAPETAYLSKRRDALNSYVLRHFNVLFTASA